MNDQAAALRARMLEREPSWNAGDVPALVVGSGKGGVGKSVLATLLAAALARAGRHVLLFDAAQNLGNLHILLGCSPATGLDAVLRDERPAAELLVPLAERLWLLPAQSGDETLHSLAPLDRARLHYRLSALWERFDAVVVDGGPGVEGTVRAAALRATRLLAVAMSEPAALSDAYALIKLVHAQAPALPVDVLVNRCEGDAEAGETFARLELACSRFLGFPLGSAGWLPECADWRRAARVPRALLAIEHDGIARLAAGLVPVRREGACRD